MITQEIGNIKIESAESPEDAKANNFSEGEYSRFYVNGKVTSYMGIVNNIIEETVKNKEKFVVDTNKIQEMQAELFRKQRETMLEQIEKMKAKGLHPSQLPIMEDFTKKINAHGLRVKQ